MARSGNQKQKILYLVQLLAEYGEVGQVLPMKAIVERLEENGILAERKSIYDDMEALRNFGIPICYSRKKPGGYYIDGELPKGLLLTQSKEALCAAESVREESWWDEGEGKEVKLSCPVELYGRVSAYLHGPLTRKDKKDGIVHVTGRAAIGNGFYGWLTALGEDVHLLKPKKAVSSYQAFLKGILKKYK